jgi:hypothetical protein
MKNDFEANVDPKLYEAAAFVTGFSSAEYVAFP